MLQYRNLDDSLIQLYCSKVVFIKKSRLYYYNENACVKYCHKSNLILVESPFQYNLAIYMKGKKGSITCSKYCLWWKRDRGLIRLWVHTRLVPGLKNMPVPVLVTLKIRYTNRKAPAQRPFLLAGELALLPAEF